MIGGSHAQRDVFVRSLAMLAAERGDRATLERVLAGLPAFLDFIPLAWASFGGHVIFGLVVGVVVKWREEAMA
jgi:hypothetical protein